MIYVDPQTNYRKSYWSIWDRIAILVLILAAEYCLEEKAIQCTVYDIDSGGNNGCNKNDALSNCVYNRLLNINGGCDGHLEVLRM